MHFKFHGIETSSIKSIIKIFEQVSAILKRVAAQLDEDTHSAVFYYSVD